MTGTDSDDDITLHDLLKKTHSTVAKANVAAGPSALSALATNCASSVKDEDDQTLATLGALKKKATKKVLDDLLDTDDEIPKKKWTKKKRCPVDSDNPSLYDTEDDDAAEKEKEKVLSKEDESYSERSNEESSEDDNSVSSEESGGPPPLVLYCSSDDDSSVDESGDDRDGGDGASKSESCCNY